MVNSDHFAVVTILRLGKTEKKGFWKLNVSCLKNADVLSELKNEIRITKSLNVLTNSYVELWETLKERLSFFFKIKSKMLNQELNEKYNKLMADFVELKTRANVTEADKEHLSEIEDELAKLNDVSYCLRLQAGMGDMECSSNAHQLISLHKKTIENNHVGLATDLAG